MQLGSENSTRRSQVECYLIADCAAYTTNTTVDGPITTSHVTVGYLELQLDVRVGNLSKVSLGAWQVQLVARSTSLHGPSVAMPHVISEAVVVRS